MTVRELIGELSKYPDDCEVVMPPQSGSLGYHSVSVVGGIMIFPVHSKILRATTWAERESRTGGEKVISLDYEYKGRIGMKFDS